MIEEELNILRQQDSALRDALRLDEAELPQMPADLNARVMGKAHLHVTEGSSHSKIRRLWPWVAAACVAGVMMLLPTLQKDTTEEKVTAKVERKEVKPKKEAPQPKAPQKAEPKKEQSVPEKRKKQVRRPTIIERHLVAQQAAPVEEAVKETPAQPQGELAQAAMPSAKSGTKTLTEHDIPITRPENYKYTPEELAQLRKQANEAYLKWVELELEISKNNLQQTAQQE